MAELTVHSKITPNKGEMILDFLLVLSASLQNVQVALSTAQCLLRLFTFDETELQRADERERKLPAVPRASR